MTTIELKQFRTGHILFKGDYPNISSAIEDAVQKGHDLSELMVQNANLDYITLDDAKMDKAIFHKCSLRHANMSEASLNAVRFVDCDLTRACLAYASLKQTGFIETPMVDADLAGAWVENIIFTCPSALDVDFSECEEFRNCVYIHEGHIHCLMTKQPITIQGLSYKVTLMNDYMKVGCMVKKYDDFATLRPETVERLFGMEAKNFSQDYIPFLQTASRLAATHSLHNYKRISDRA